MPFTRDLWRNAVRDVELSAREGVGDVATASQIEAKSQLVDVRLARNVVVAVARQSNPLPFEGFFDPKRPGACRCIKIGHEGYAVMGGVRYGHQWSVISYPISKQAGAQ